MGGGARDGRRPEAGSPRLAGQAAIRGELSEWPEGGFGVQGVEIISVLVASQDAVNAGAEHLRGAVLGDVRVAGITEGGDNVRIAGHDPHFQRGVKIGRRVH